MRKLGKVPFGGFGPRSNRAMIRACRFGRTPAGRAVKLLVLAPAAVGAVAGGILQGSGAAHKAYTESNHTGMRRTVDVVGAGTANFAKGAWSGAAGGGTWLLRIFSTDH